MKFKIGKLGLIAALVLSLFSRGSVDIYANGAAVTAVNKDGVVTLSNDFISREYSILNDKLKTNLITNKQIEGGLSLIPQEGSLDFVVNTITHEDDAIIPIVTYPTLDLNRDAWSATLSNSNGEEFGETEVVKLFDGIDNTFVDKYQIQGYPISLSIDLGKVETVGSFSFQKRPGYTDEAYGKNGSMGKFKLYVSEDGITWKEAGDGEFVKEDYNLHKVDDLYNVGDLVYANFNEIVETQYVRIDTLSDALGNTQEFTGAEVKLYSDRITTNSEIILPVKSLNRTEWQASLDGKQAGKVIDGDDATTNSTNNLPAELVIDMGSEQTFSSFSYQKRPGYTAKEYGINGTMGDYELFVSDDGEIWESAGEGSFTREDYNLHKVDDLFNVGDLVYGNFNKTYTKQYVKIVSKSDVLGGLQEFNVAELRLYEDLKVNPEVITPETALSSDKLTLKDVKIEDTAENDGKSVRFNFEPFAFNGDTYTITLVSVLEAKDHYLRSFLEISSDNKDARIDYIALDQFVLADDVQGLWHRPDLKDVSSQWIRTNELMLGQPIYVQGMFMGSEFPATDNNVIDKTISMRYYSGKSFAKMQEDGQLTTDGKFVSWPNVIGSANGTTEAVVQSQFYDYINDIATKTDFRRQYNSWYDNMMGISEESIDESFFATEKHLSASGVKPLDSYVVDDGWNNYNDPTFTGIKPNESGTTYNQTGFWEMNSKFPNELYTSSSRVNKLQSKFGLWLGPQGGYNFFSSFSQFLQQEGTGYSQNDFWTSINTASSNYVHNLTELFLDYQTRFDIDYWKLDGFAVRPSSNENQETMVGGTNNMYYTTDLWEKWTNTFELMRAQRSAEGKELFINATCYVNLSPWLLQWVNTVWVQDSGDTGGLGYGNSFEQKISYRDNVYFNLYEKNKLQFPLKNIYNHDPIYGVSDGSNTDTDTFRNFLMINAARGTAFWELYYSPSIMDEDKYLVTADVMDLAEEYHYMLKHAVMFGDRPLAKAGEAGDVNSNGIYGYSGWVANEGIITFRNSTETTKTYTVVLDDAIGVKQGLANVEAKQVHPYLNEDPSGTYSYGDSFEVTLEPLETRMVHFGAKDTKSPELLSAKAIDKQTIRVKFDERVQLNETSFKVDGKTVDFELLADYRTVELKTETLNDTFKLSYTLKDEYANLLNGSVDLNYYADEIINKLDAVEDLKDSKTLQEHLYQLNDTRFVEFEGQEVSLKDKNSFSGSTDFSIEMSVKTTDSNTQLMRNGDDVSLNIDQDGFLVFKVKDQILNSKDIRTTVVEKAHGTFGTDRYVPTTTQDTTVGQVNDGNLHTIVAVREANGILKLYVDGELMNSLYEEDHINESISHGDVVLGGSDFNGLVGDFKLHNKALGYDDAHDIFESYALGSRSIELDRELWTAISCSEMNNAVGDGPASSAIDGKTNTWWHTNYAGVGEPHEGNHSIEIDFGKNSTFDVFNYIGRAANANGNIKDFILQSWNETTENWETILTDTFLNGGLTSIELDKPVTTTKLRLEALNSHNGQKYAAAVEISVGITANNVQLPLGVIDEALSQIKDYDAQDYTKETYSSYLEAKNNLLGINKVEIKSEELEELMDQYLNAVESLELKKPESVNKSLLNALVEELEALDEELYTASSYAQLRLELDNAKVILEDTKANQIQVDSMITTLQKARELLVEKDVTPPSEVDRSELEALINEVKDMDSNLYTEESFHALSEALKDAESLILDLEATQEEIDQMVTEILGLIDELVEVDHISPTVDKKELEELIQKIEVLDATQYSEESFANLAEILKSAKELLSNESVSQEDVDAMAALLKEAYQALELIVTEDPKPEKPSENLPGTGVSTNNVGFFVSSLMIVLGFYLIIMKKRTVNH